MAMISVDPFVGWAEIQGFGADTALAVVQRHNHRKQLLRNTSVIPSLVALYFRSVGHHPRFSSERDRLLVAGLVPPLLSLLTGTAFTAEI